MDPRLSLLPLFFFVKLGLLSFFFLFVILDLTVLGGTNYLITDLQIFLEDSSRLEYH